MPADAVVVYIYTMSTKEKLDRGWAKDQGNWLSVHSMSFSAPFSRNDRGGYSSMLAHLFSFFFFFFFSKYSDMLYINLIVVF